LLYDQIIADLIMSHEDLVVHSPAPVGLTLTGVTLECHRSVVIELLELLRALVKYAGIEPYSPYLTSQPCYSCWFELVSFSRDARLITNFASSGVPRIFVLFTLRLSLMKLSRFDFVLS
jgi:hypothetical protein